MVQILQITLRTAEFKSKLSSASKALLKLSFGDAEKPFPHPRIVKDNMIKFDGQRMSLSSYSEEQIQKAYLHISVIENGKTLDYGKVEIDILKLKEFKDSTKVSLELENQNCFINLQALSSTYLGGGGTSEIDNKSQRSELLSPLRAHSTIGSNNVKQALKNVLEYTPQEKQNLKQEQAEKPPKTEIKRDSQKISKPVPFNKTTSLNYAAPRLVEDDRKSQISEKPVRQPIKRTQQKPKQQISREPSLTKSASNIIKKTSQIVSSTNIKPPTPVQTPTAKTQSKKEEPKPIVSSKPKSQKKITQPAPKTDNKTEISILAGFQQKDLIQFVGVAIIAFILGFIFKKL